jgi:glycosyltransferase involved in cell wall biosynthesis
VPDKVCDAAWSAPRRRALLLLDASSSWQVAALRLITETALTGFETAAVSSSGGDSAEMGDVRWLVPDGRDHLDWLLYADTIVSLDPHLSVSLRSTRQRLFFLVDHDMFVREGLAYEQPWPLAGRIGAPVVDALVYDSPETGTTNDGTATVAFRMDGSDSAAAVFAELIASSLPPEEQPRPVVVLCIESCETGFLAAEVLEVLRRGAERGQIDIVLATVSSPRDPALGRIPFTHLALGDRFLGAAAPLDPAHKTIAVAASPEIAGRAGLRHPIHGLLLPPVLSLLPAGWGEPDVVEPLRRLTADPTEFLLDRLRNETDPQAVAAQSLAIIIPHYNTDFTVLVRSIDSALACQSEHKATEVIVVDDGSSFDLSDRLAEHYGNRWASVRFLSKPNEGLGRTRNFGVRQTDASYVFFLDSDDVVVAANIGYFMSAATLLDADAVVGKRLLVDEEGNFISDSMNYVFDGLLRRVERGEAVVVDDQMANNKIVRRTHFLDHEFWFREGAYEDNEFAARLYNSSDRIWLLNLPLHLWHQYGHGLSITKTPTAEKAFQKLESLEHAWVHLSPRQRSRRLWFNLQHDLRHVVTTVDANHDERSALLKRTTRYVAVRGNYVRAAHLELVASFFVAATRANAPRRISASVPRSSAGPGRTVFFPRSLFHLMSCLLYKLQTSDAVVAAIDTSAVGLDDELVAALRSSRILDDVWSFSAPVHADVARIRLVQGSSGVCSILDTIYRRYESELGDLVDEDDRCAYFLEGLPEQYYMDRRFREQYKFEDGRRSIVREQGVGSSFGVWGDVWNLVTQRDSLGLRVTPPPTRLFLNSMVQREALSEHLASAVLESFPFDDLLHKHRSSMLRFFELAFGALPPVRSGANVVLTQPLYRNYCSVEEHLAVVARLAVLAGPDAVLKPHPADECDYSAIGVQVLPAAIPFEYLDLAGCRFATAYSFGSSTAGAVDGHVKLFTLEEFEPDDVREAIADVARATDAAALRIADRLVRANANLVRRARDGDRSGNRWSLGQLRKAALVTRTAVRLALSDRDLFRRRLAARLLASGRIQSPAV